MHFRTRIKEDCKLFNYVLILKQASTSRDVFLHSFVHFSNSFFEIAQEQFFKLFLPF